MLGEKNTEIRIFMGKHEINDSIGVSEELYDQYGDIVMAYYMLDGARQSVPTRQMVNSYEREEDFVEDMETLQGWLREVQDALKGGL